MNAGAMVAVMAAAAAAKAREEALDAFRLTGATSADRALTLAQLGLEENTALRGELLNDGIVRGVDTRGQLLPAGKDAMRAPRFYLDEMALIAVRDNGTPTRKAGRIAVAIVIAILLLFIGVVASLPGAL
jgi:hypothetical protein